MDRGRPGGGAVSTGSNIVLGRMMDRGRPGGGSELKTGFNIILEWKLKGIHHAKSEWTQRRTGYRTNCV